MSPPPSNARGRGPRRTLSTQTTARGKAPERVVLSPKPHSDLEAHALRPAARLGRLGRGVPQGAARPLLRLSTLSARHLPAILFNPFAPAHLHAQARASFLRLGHRH